MREGVSLDSPKEFSVMQQRKMALWGQAPCHYRRPNQELRVEKQSLCRSGMARCLHCMPYLEFSTRMWSPRCMRPCTRGQLVFSNQNYGLRVWLGMIESRGKCWDQTQQSQCRAVPGDGGCRADGRSWVVGTAQHSPSRRF